MVKILNEAYITECKRLFSKKNSVMFFVLGLLTLYLVQIGINNYKGIIESKEPFLDIELLKVGQYLNYNQFGAYGFRILFIPPPLSIYFVNSSTISELTANVDSGERLNIYNSFKGRTLFAVKSGGFKDFSGILLLLGSLLILYLGYESFIHKDYLRFMKGLLGCRKLFCSIVLARISVMVLFFFFTVGLSWLLLKINGIKLLAHDYARLSVYLAVLVLTMVFFFVLGTIAGSFNSGFFGFVMVIASWLALVFLAPGIIGEIISRKADNIVSNYHLEFQKLKNIMDFERRAYEQAGMTTENNIDAVRELIKDYRENELKENLALEKRLEKDMSKNIQHFQTLSLLFPSTFYLSNCNEVSGKGYENFILFYNYVLTLKEKFVNFYIDHRYYSDGPLDAPTTVESFIKGNENLFYAKSLLPGNFIIGLLVTLLYIVGLLIASYFLFKRSLRF